MGASLSSLWTILGVIIYSLEEKKGSKCKFLCTWENPAGHRNIVHICSNLHEQMTDLEINLGPD